MNPESFWIDEQVVVVTGGAGQLGSSLCERLDGLGNTVVMADLDPNECERVIEERALSSTHPLELDVTDVDSVRSGLQTVADDFGGIDALVNNAGVAVFTPMEERTVQEFDKVMRTNVYGTFFCTQAALEHMDTGSIVNVGSIYGVESPDPRIYGDSGLNSSEVYGASKAAIIQMTRYLAVHTKENIRVNCVSPGGILADQDEHFRENYKNQTPMGRMAREDDIVDVILFLCADSSRYITGQNIVIDGGFTIW